MTREEAIEQFQNCIELIKQDGKDWLDDRDIPMLNMAIEALQAKMDGDIISRQVAVDALIKYRDSLPTPVEDYCKGFNDGLSHAITYMDLVPSAEPKTGWIPCSERLPKNSGRYLVTLKDNWAINVKVAVYGVMPHDTHNKKVFWLYDSCYDDLDITEDVVAWIPLPEPYTEEGEEE